MLDSCRMKSSDFFSTEVDDEIAFLEFLGCFVSFLILSDGLSLSRLPFSKV